MFIKGLVVLIFTFLFLSSVCYGENTYGVNGTHLGPLYDKHGELTGPYKDFYTRLCKRKFVFILATGRSGSTSILNMINALPNYSISGEHNGQFWSWFGLYSKFQFTQSVYSKWKEPYTDFETDQAEDIAKYTSWEHQAIHDVEFFDMMQEWYFTHTGSIDTNNDVHTTVKGLKEIRYNDEKVLDFIAHAFPCAKLVFNCRRRDFRRQSNSAFMSVSNKSADDLREQADGLMKYSKRPLVAARSIVVHTEDMHKLDMWTNLAHFLGRPGCKYHDVYHDNAKGGYDHDVKEKSVVKCEGDGTVPVNLRSRSPSSSKQ